MPTISAHISNELFEKVQAKVDAQYKGKRSPYLVDLIEANINEMVELPSKENENMFVDLCDMIAGYTATTRAKKSFEKLKGRVSQRAFLEFILRRAAIASTWLSKHPEAKYDGLRFHHSNEYSESHTSSSSTSVDMSNVA